MHRSRRCNSLPACGGAGFIEPESTGPISHKHVIEPRDFPVPVRPTAPGPPAGVGAGGAPEARAMRGR